MGYTVLVGEGRFCDGSLRLWVFMKFRRYFVLLSFGLLMSILRSPLAYNWSSLVLCTNLVELI